MSRKLAFRWAFLLITALAIGWELLASFDSSTDTEPWTDLIADHVSPWVTFSTIAVLVIWLPIHFVQRYKRKQASKGGSP